ncbi:hypothetical protein DIPPA_20849 [Diplonema papillatum]|nr:hypothetical protein DIPPA_20849 [Diplonema papillatum]
MLFAAFTCLVVADVEFTFSTAGSYTFAATATCGSANYVTGQNGQRYDSYVYGENAEEDLKQIHVTPSDIAAAFCVDEPSTQTFSIVLHDPGSREVVTSYYFTPSKLT